MTDNPDNDLTIDGRELLADLLGRPPEPDAPEPDVRVESPQPLPTRGPSGTQVAAIVVVCALSVLLFGSWLIAGLS